MENDVLTGIARIINTYCKTHIAYIPLISYEYWDVKNGKLVKTKCRVLRIETRAKNKKTMVWNIFEKDIEKVIFIDSQKDNNFVERVATDSLSLCDVERIIRKSSYKLLNLKMSYKTTSTVKN